MKRIHILFAMFATLLLASCVEDEGNNVLSAINEVEVSGIEETYNKIGFKETLSITADVKGSLSGSDDSQFDYQWYICNAEVLESTHKHTVIGTQKTLEFPVNIASGSYRLYFRATDKATGMKWEKVSSLNVWSPFNRGFYLWGDKEDGTCGMDFVGMITDRDTTVVKDLFRNTAGLKKAKNLIFTGYYSSNSVVDLWAVGENGSYPLEHDPSMENFGILEDESLDKIIFPMIEVTRPFQLANIGPYAYGSSNTNMSRSWRFLVTDGDIYFATSVFTGESYGNPINRYSASSTELYKPSPYVFYKHSTYISAAAFFDETNHRFTAMNTSTYALTHTVTCSDKADPFWFDQTKYDPVRDLVYGENAYGGYSYALMNDANGDYYIYKFSVNRYGAAGLAKQAAYTVDKSVAVGFDQASHYAFFSEQSIILYSVGSQLWAYDYKRNAAKSIAMDGEITYLAMDFHSNNTPTDFIVATYSEADKGTVYKYTIEDNQNDIVIEPHSYQTESYPWKTDLRVAKVEYRNSSL